MMILNAFRKALQFIARQTGYDRLGTPFVRYLFVYAAFTIASTLSTTYFNVFLLRATGSDLAMMLCNLLLACVQPFVMLIALRVLRAGSEALCQRVGLILHAAAYVVLALVSDASVAVVYTVSAVFAAGNAFYFTAYTPQILAYTTNDTRDTAYGAMGLFGTVISLILPLFAGFFISAFGDLTGYRVLFGVSSLLMLGGALLSFRLVPVPRAADAGKGRLRATAKRFFRSKAVLGIMVITLLDGVRVYGFTYFGSLLTYEILQKESVMGVFNTVSALVMLLANLVYGRVVTAKRRTMSVLISSFMLLGVVGLVCISRTMIPFAIYTVTNMSIAIFMNNPVITTYMSVIQSDPVLTDNGAEVHVLREIFVASGRALGLLPALFVQNPGQAAPYMMLGLSVMQVFSALLMMYLKKRKAI